VNLRSLCRLEDIPDGGTKAFPAAPGGFTGLFAVRRGPTAVVYVNACPHLGVALNWRPDEFLTADRRHIICRTHDAEFAIDDGLCLRGPCYGDRLEAVECVIEDGWLRVPADAGL